MLSGASLRVAVAAHVKVLALLVLAAPPRARLDLCLAHVAVANKRRLAGVVQVVQRHHGGVLGAAQSVKLVVVALAEVQELGARVQDVTLHQRLVIVRVGGHDFAGRAARSVSSS